MVTEFEPAWATVGLNIACEVFPKTIAFSSGELAVPLSFQVKLTGSASGSIAIVVSATLPPIPADVFVLGSCEAQLGGAFLVTVQVCSAVVLPSETVATSVLLPVVKLDEVSVREAPLPARVTPLSRYVTSHPARLGAATKVVVVAPAEATRTLS
jgi:hypothetical protein